MSNWIMLEVFCRIMAGVCLTAALAAAAVDTAEAAPAAVPVADAASRDL